MLGLFLAVGASGCAAVAPRAGSPWGSDGLRRAAERAPQWEAPVPGADPEPERRRGQGFDPLAPLPRARVEAGEAPLLGPVAPGEPPIDARPLRLQPFVGAPGVFPLPPGPDLQPKAAPLEEYGRVNLEAPALVDPLPIYDDTRFPFFLDVAPEGVPLALERGGEYPLDVFGLATNDEEGEALLGFLRYRF